MASDATLSRLGQSLLAGDADALFLVKFTGEVLVAFENATKFVDKHYIRTINEGKSARFDAIGDATAAYHTPGNDITDAGNTIKHDQFTITVDGMLIASVMIAEIDELMNHYDVRSKYANKLGIALAQTFDKNVARTALLAARASAKIPDGDGGTELTNASAGTDGSALEDCLYLAQQNLDEKNVSEMGRTAFLRPAQYRILAQRHGLLDTQVGGTGSVAEGKIMKVAGFDIVKTNNLPSSNVTGTYGNKYNGDFSNTVGLCMTDEAVGTVKLKDISTEAEWMIAQQSTLMLAKYALGHGILRPECAVEIKTA